MIRSIEMMLGLDPMNKFDSVADPDGRVLSVTSST